MNDLRKLIILTLILYKFICNPTFGQTDAALRSERVKHYIYLGPVLDNSNKFRYVVDNNFQQRNATTIDDEIDISSEKKINFMIEYKNPLKYTISIRESALKDPNVETTNEFINNLINQLNQMRGEKADEIKPDTSPALQPGDATNIKTNLKAIESANKSKSTKSNAIALKVATDKMEGDIQAQKQDDNESLKNISDNGLLTVAMWQTSMNCFGSADDQKKLLKKLLNTMANSDSIFSEFPVISKKLIQQMALPNTAAELQENLKNFNEKISSLKNNLKENRKELNLLSSSKGNTPTENIGCPALKVYSIQIIDNYIKSKELDLKRRDEIIKSFETLIGELTESLARVDENGYYINEVLIKPGYIKEVTITQNKRIINYDPDTDLLNSKIETNSRIGKIKIREYSKIITEFAAGFLYTNLSYPEFGTGLENNQTVVKLAKTHTVNFVGAGMLNIIPAGYQSWVYPMAQIGIGTGKGIPTLYFGIGGRAIKPLNNISLSLGTIWYWRKELSTLNPSDPVSGTADIENDLEYKFVEKPKPCIGLQYSF